MVRNLQCNIFLNSNCPTHCFLAHLFIIAIIIMSSWFRGLFHLKKGISLLYSQVYLKSFQLSIFPALAQGTFTDQLLKRIQVSTNNHIYAGHGLLFWVCKLHYLLTKQIIKFRADICSSFLLSWKRGKYYSNPFVTCVKQRSCYMPCYVYFQSSLYCQANLGHEKLIIKTSEK